MINYDNVSIVTGKPENDRKNLSAEWLISVLDADQKLYEYYSADDIAELSIEEVENRLTQIGVDHERAVRNATKMVNFHTSSDVDKLNLMLLEEEDLNNERADVIRKLPADEVSNKLKYLGVNTDAVIKSVQDIVDQLPIAGESEVNHLRKTLVPRERAVLSTPLFPHLRYVAAAAGLLLVAGVTSLCIYNSSLGRLAGPKHIPRHVAAALVAATPKATLDTFPTDTNSKIGSNEHEVSILIINRQLVNSPSSVSFIADMRKALSDDKTLSGGKAYVKIAFVTSEYDDLKKVRNEVRNELAMLGDSIDNAEIVKCNNIDTGVILANHREVFEESSCKQNLHAKSN